MSKASFPLLRVWRLAVSSTAESHTPGETPLNRQRAALHGAAALWGERRPLDCPDCQPLALRSTPFFSPARTRLSRRLRRGFSHLNVRRRWQILQVAIERALEEMSAQT